MKKRWLLYVGAGLLFGILDWFYLNARANFPWGDLGEAILVIPVILFIKLWDMDLHGCSYLHPRNPQIWQPSALCNCMCHYLEQRNFFLLPFLDNPACL